MRKKRTSATTTDRGTESFRHSTQRLDHETINCRGLSRSNRRIRSGIGRQFQLAVIKLVGGLLGHSFALVSDAANSMGDVLTSLVALFALRVAQKPADAEHPYGHTRIEAVAGSNVPGLILVAAVWIGWEAISRFLAPHPLPPIWTLWIAGGNAAIKESLYRYKVRIGRRTGSSAVIANAWDHVSTGFCATCWFT